MPLAPCIPAMPSANAHAIPPQAVGQDGLSCCSMPSKIRSDACCLPAPARPPHFPGSQDAGSVAPRSLPTQSGTPGAAPACGAAPGIECCRRPATVPDLLSCTSAPQAGTDWPQTSLPSAPAGSDTPAPDYLPLCAALQGLPPAGDDYAHPEYVFACYRSASQLEQTDTPAASSHRLSHRSLPPSARTSCATWPAETSPYTHPPIFCRAPLRCRRSVSHCCTLQGHSPGSCAASRVRSAASLPQIPGSASPGTQHPYALPALRIPATLRSSSARKIPTPTHQNYTASSVAPHPRHSDLTPSASNAAGSLAPGAPP